MKILERVKNAGRVLLGYDAVASGSRRNAPRSTIKTEDSELVATKRRNLVATTLDQQRNFAIVGWMVRKHLDYVSRFSFHSQTGVPDIDKRLDLLWNNWANRKSCDTGNRHNLNRRMRLFETGKVINGDAGILKVKGGKLQGIEGNRIAMPAAGLPEALKSKVTPHGLILNKLGAVDQYVVCGKDDTGKLAFQEAVKSADLVFDGYFSREDQTRGVSPLACAINAFQDVYEALDYQLVKIKMHAMLGTVIYSDSVAGGSGFGETGSGTGEAAKYTYDMKPGMKLRLNPGDRLETVESKTPSVEFMAFTDVEIKIALLSLDIPESFYNAIKANFSGRKMDWSQYEKSSEHKREANREALWEIAEWKIPQLVAADTELPAMLSSVGLLPETLQYDFLPQETAWMDEAAEVNAVVAKIGAGLSSITRECKKKNVDVREIVAERRDEIRMFADAGVPLTIGQPGQTPYAPTDAPKGDTVNPDEPPQQEDDNVKSEDSGGLVKWLK